MEIELETESTREAKGRAGREEAGMGRGDVKGEACGEGKNPAKIAESEGE